MFFHIVSKFETHGDGTMFEEQREIILENIHQRLANRKWSLADLSVRMRNGKGGRRPTRYASNTLNRPGLPNTEFLAEVAVVFRCELAELFFRDLKTLQEEFRAKIIRETISSIFSGPIRPQELFQWHANYGGKLEGCDQFIEHLDVYGVPDDTQMPINPLRMGRESVATSVIGVHQLAAVRRRLSEAPPGHNQSIAQNQKKVIETQQISAETVDLHLKLSSGGRVDERYFRVELPIKLENGANGLVTAAYRLPADHTAITVEDVR